MTSASLTGEITDDETPRRSYSRGMSTCTPPPISGLPDVVELPDTVRLLERLRDVAPVIDETASVPADFLSELGASGLLEMLNPPPEGTPSVPLPAVFRAYERVARIDASIAWRVWNGNFGFLYELLGAAGRDALRSAVPTRIPRFANAGQPGRARRTSEGWLVDGRWPLVSGADTADWFVLGALAEDGDAAGTVLRVPLRADQVRVQSDWDGTGLRGAGNRVVTAVRATVTDDLVTVMRPAPGSAEPDRFAPMLLVAPGVSAVTLGIARGALDLATRRLRDDPGRGTDPVCRMQLARADASLRGAFSGLLEAAAVIEHRRTTDEAVTPLEQARMMASMFHAAEVAADALDAAAALGGSASLRRGSALERVLRDGATALRHGNQSATGYPAAGALLIAADDPQ
jgi:alkylation response protein AidB-like acyl-CoA dehydrogenase